jgi:beta-lactam-binding protein with PASTA domain
VFGNEFGGGDDWYSVISTDPPAGAEIAATAKMRIVVASEGTTSFYANPMPDLRGPVDDQWASQSRGICMATRANVTTTYRRPKAGEASDTIVAQSPAPGTSMELGTKIQLTQTTDSADLSSDNSCDSRWYNF